MVLDVIKQRASIRSYSAKKISDEDLKTILEAARIAPSWMNVQPWHFIAVNSTETKKKLFELANGQKHVLEAPTVILILADIEAWNEDRFKKILAKKDGITEEVMEFIFNNSGLYPKLHGEQKLLLRTIEQTTYAMSHILLQAKALGIDSCVIGAFGNELTEFNTDLYNKIKESLSIPQSNCIAGMITLGYKKEESTTPKKFRKEFDEVISKENYNKKF